MPALEEYIEEIRPMDGQEAGLEHDLCSVGRFLRGQDP